MRKMKKKYKNVKRRKLQTVAAVEFYNDNSRKIMGVWKTGTGIDQSKYAKYSGLQNVIMSTVAENASQNISHSD